MNVILVDDWILLFQYSFKFENILKGLEVELRKFCDTLFFCFTLIGDYVPWESFHWKKITKSKFEKRKVISSFISVNLEGYLNART